MAQLKATTIYGDVTLQTGGKIVNSTDATLELIDTNIKLSGAVQSTDVITQKQLTRKVIDTQFWSNDFLYFTAASVDPWYGAAIAGGTVTTGTSTNVHPGTGVLRNTTATNSGYSISTTTGVLGTLAGGETTRLIFYIRNNSALATTITTLFGFFNNTTVATKPTYGAFAKMTYTNSATTATLTAETINNTGNSTTHATTYSLAFATWYNLYITVNSDASSVNYRLTASPSAGDLWNVDIATNIPSASVGHGVKSLSVDNVAVSNLFDMDYMELEINRVINR